MKRPMAVVGITFILTLIVICSTGEMFAICFIALSFIGLIISVIIKRLRQDTCIPSICLAVMSACLLFLVKTYTDYKPQMKLADKTATIEGTVIEDNGKSSSGVYRYIIKTDTIDGKQIDCKIRISSKKLSNLDYYDKVKMEDAKIYEIGSNKQKIKNYYKSKSVYLGAYTFGDSYILKTNKKPFYYNFIKLREYIKEIIKERLPNGEGDVITALLIGDKSGMDVGVYDTFVKSGTTHIFAVSGMHLSIWSMFIYLCFRKFGVRRKKSSIVAILFILCFMALTGFSSSVVRAGIMMMIFFGAKVFNRESDSFSSLGFATIILTFLNPYSVLNVGLLFSFLSTLGILILLQYNENIVNKASYSIKNKLTKKIVIILLEVILTTFSATLFTLPIQVLIFGAFSLISPVTNLLVLNVAGITMIIAGAGVVLSAIPVFWILKMPLLLISGLLAKYIMWCTKTLSNLPFSYVSLHNDYILPWIISIMLLTIVAYILKIEKNRKLKLISLLSVNILLASMLCYNIINSNITRIEVVNVGKGVCVVLNRGNNSILMGVGGEYYAGQNVNSALFMNNTRQLDLMVLPQSKKDSSMYLECVNDNYKISNIVQKGEKKDLTTTINVWDDVEIGCDSNTQSSFATIKIKGFKILVVFSNKLDISNVPKEYLHSDILICRSYTPKDLDYTQFSTIIISDDKKKSDIKVQEINKNNGNAMSVEKTVVEVRTSGDSNYLTRSYEN